MSDQTEQAPSKHKSENSYTIVVAAATADDAIAIAAEALPIGAALSASEAHRSAGHGADESWTVTLTYSGGTRRAKNVIS